jgi:hypothetical protein
MAGDKGLIARFGAFEWMLVGVTVFLILLAVLYFVNMPR